MTTNYTMHHDDPSHWGLPDPDTQPGFYDAVPTKRLIAFVVDLIIASVLAAHVLPFTAFLGLFFFPFLVAVVSFAYRIVTIAGGSVTWGMRLMGIEFRTKSGECFDLGMAFLHTALFTAWSIVSIAQIISVVLMLTTARKQGLSDLILGSAAINKPALF